MLDLIFVIPGLTRDLIWNSRTLEKDTGSQAGMTNTYHSPTTNHYLLSTTLLFRFLHRLWCLSFDSLRLINQRRHSFFNFCFNFVVVIFLKKQNIECWQNTSSIQHKQTDKPNRLLISTRPPQRIASYHNFKSD